MMRFKTPTVATAVLVLVLVLLPLWAVAGGAQNAIVLDAASSDNTGEIYGRGTFTLAKDYKVDQILLLAYLDGALKKSVTCDYTDKGSWAGLMIGMESGKPTR